MDGDVRKSCADVEGGVRVGDYRGPKPQAGCGERSIGRWPTHLETLGCLIGHYPAYGQEVRHHGFGHLELLPCL